MRIDYIFQNKSNRDAKFKELKSQGHDVVKRRSTNQLLHPQYVEDYEGAAKYDTGLGNTVYKTHFSKLYHIESKPEWMK